MTCPPRYLPPRLVRDDAHLNSRLSGGSPSRGKYTPGSISSGTGDSSDPRADHHRRAIPVQALLVLACLREGETSAELAAGFGIKYRHRLKISHRDGGAASRPRPEAAPGPWPPPGTPATPTW
jgi:hypothetical protein